MPCASETTPGICAARSSISLIGDSRISDVRGNIRRPAGAPGEEFAGDDASDFEDDPAAAGIPGRERHGLDARTRRRVGDFGPVEDDHPGEIEADHYDGDRAEASVDLAVMQDLREVERA